MRLERRRSDVRICGYLRARLLRESYEQAEEGGDENEEALSLAEALAEAIREDGTSREPSEETVVERLEAALDFLCQFEEC